MKKLSQEEYEKTFLKGRGRSSVFYDAINNLQKSESILISKEEFNRGKTPSRICRYIEKKSAKKFRCDETMDVKGWVIKRME